MEHSDYKTLLVNNINSSEQKVIFELRQFELRC